MLPAALALALLLGLGTAPPPAADQPQIVEVYPNPVATNDDGEFVTLWLPSDTNPGEYALADEHGTAPLSAGTDRERAWPPPQSGRYVTVSTHPNLTAELLDRRVRPVDDRLQLANGGERLRLLHNQTVVDEFRYESAPEGEVYNVTTGQWRPLGATDLPVVIGRGGTVETFVLPDEGERAVELLDGAEERILLAGYTLTSRRAVESLIAADRRGVSVEVLVDDAPVGGLSERGVAALDRLSDAGITVTASGGERARYRFHHAKYAVVDDRALVTTENWKPAGLGGRGSRGWALITRQDSVVDGLVRTFRADAGWEDATPWDEVDGVTPVSAEPASGEYPAEFDTRSLPVERTRLLVAPDNAQSELAGLIRGAEESILIEQVRIGDRSFPLLQQVLDAAERGVRVRILLSGAWYVRDENEQLADWLTEQAAAEGLPLSVRIAEPRGRFEKIHAKGMIVDGEQVVLGSANWNNNSLERNREVVAVLESEAAADYFEDVFEADWGGRGRQFPAGLAVVCLLVALLATVAAVRIRFEN